MNNVIVPVERASGPQKPEISPRSALSCRAQQRTERRAKRLNLIKTARRWTEASPHLAEDERPHRLMLLDRCEAEVDDWWGRSKKDQRAFDLLVARVRARPLDSSVIQSLRQQPSSADATSLSAILARLGGRHGGGGSVSRPGHPRLSDHNRRIGKLRNERSDES